MADSAGGGRRGGGRGEAAAGRLPAGFPAWRGCWAPAGRWRGSNKSCAGGGEESGRRRGGVCVCVVCVVCAGVGRGGERFPPRA